MLSISSRRQSRAAAARSFDWYCCASVGAATNTTHNTSSERSIDHPRKQELTLPSLRQRVAPRVCPIFLFPCRARFRLQQQMVVSAIDHVAGYSESAANLAVRLNAASDRAQAASRRFRTALPEQPLRLEAAGETGAVCRDRVLPRQEGS